MKLINDWGSVMRISDRNYLRYLRAGAEGQNPDPLDFGGRRIGDIEFHTADRRPKDYQYELETELRRRKERQEFQPHKKHKEGKERK